MALRRLIYVRRDNHTIKTRELHYHLRTIEYRTGGISLKTSLIRSTNRNFLSHERKARQVIKAPFREI